MNLIAANAISMFISSFARETEWDMSNYRTWLTTKRPKFAIPWAIPVMSEESQWNKELMGGKLNTMDDVITRIGKREDALLFDIDENDVRNNGGKKDSCCVLVKIRGEFDIKERETIKRIIKDKFNIEESRMIFVKIPIIDGDICLFSIYNWNFYKNHSGFFDIEFIFDNSLNRFTFLDIKLSLNFY